MLSKIIHRDSIITRSTQKERGLIRLDAGTTNNKSLKSEASITFPQNLHTKTKTFTVLVKTQCGVQGNITKVATDPICPIMYYLLTDILQLNL